VSGQSLNKGFKFGTRVGDQWRLDERPDPLMGLVSLPNPKELSDKEQVINMVLFYDRCGCSLYTSSEEKRAPMLLAS
jgi:hypothetical protein